MLINAEIVCSSFSSLPTFLRVLISLPLWLSVLSLSSLSVPCSLWGQMKVVPSRYLQHQHRYPHERPPAAEQMH